MIQIICLCFTRTEWTPRFAEPQEVWNSTITSKELLACLLFLMQSLRSVWKWCLIHNNEHWHISVHDTFNPLLFSLTTFQIEGSSGPLWIIAAPEYTAQLSHASRERAAAPAEKHVKVPFGNVLNP